MTVTLETEPGSTPVKIQQATPTLGSLLYEKLWDFFCAPADGRPLAALRIGLSLMLLLQVLVLNDWMYAFLASDGIVQQPVASELWKSSLPNIPNLQWLSQWLSPAYISEHTAIRALCSLYVLALVFLALGLYTRIASVTVWFLYWSMANSAFMLHYGFDIYAHIFLFYLMLMPCADHWSLDAKRHPEKIQPSAGKRFALRVLQLQLCLSYLATGLLKAAGEQWWNGDLLWKALTMPLYRQMDLTWLDQWPFLLVAGGWLTLILEIGYCVFIWPRRFRWPWIMAIMALHLGIVVFLGLHFFGFLMCLFTLTIFGVSPEPDSALVSATDNRAATAQGSGLILFDGDCSLCNRWVRFVTARDPARRFRFAPLASAEAEAALAGSGQKALGSTTIFLVLQGRVYQRSTAVLMICRYLIAPWPLVYCLIIIPTVIRDAVYKLVARNRYRLFGKVEHCPLPGR